MGQSYRIRTELGVNKTINVQLDQEFEQLEILSLKIQQEDVYIRSCADYGVIVGRVTANNGFGLPNARVSIFIPITTVDESNPIISSIYPYKSPSDKNEDGYRYNLLPYEKSYSVHAATGTIPSRLDALTGTTAVEIYDRYYKFTAKTNDSGDYMIMGVPLGLQTVVMDVDLSDIGEFSLTPQDLIRMGLATEAQVAGNRFRTSTDLNSLPQIINLVKGIEISPLWGDPDICDIAINRLDFDLRDEANVNIQPTSVFMGSIYSTSDAYRVRRNAKPKDDMGNLCSLQSGPGQILAIRQTIQQDTIGNPILEQYQLEQSGNIIDGDGVWLTELPMNLDYYITNEFGERVISNDPTIGIPTKAKYRFKIKWTQPTALTEQTRRPYFLVPNIKEYGWTSSVIDPNLQFNPSSNAELAGSYYFGLDWTGYTNTQAAINCDDTFYQFDFNKVYTVSGLIDEFKNGGRGRFIGIKEIDSQDCESTINKFPVNEGFRNFDFIFFLFAILMQLVQIIGIPLLIVYHIAAAILENYAKPLIIALIGWIIKNVIAFGFLVAVYIALIIASFGVSIAGVVSAVLQLTVWTILLIKAKKIKKFIEQLRFGPFKLPMVTYPDCQACECDPEILQSSTNATESFLVSQLSNSSAYYENLVKAQERATSQSPSDDTYEANNSLYAQILSEALAGFGSSNTNPSAYKNGVSSIVTFPDSDNTRRFAVSKTITPGERINTFNVRNKYFQGINRIKATFASDVNNPVGLYHYDNTLTILSPEEFEPGTLLTFVNPSLTTDKNYLWTGTTGGSVLQGINGRIQTDQFTTQVKYAIPTDNSQTTESTTLYTIPSATTECVDSITIDVTTSGTVTYNTCNGGIVIYSALTLGSHTITNVNCISTTNLGGTAEYTVVSFGESCQRYVYPSDIEYYQVLTAITITTNIVNGVPQYSIPNLGSGVGFWNYLTAPSSVQIYKEVKGNLGSDGWLEDGAQQNLAISNFADFSDSKILILQRGVDPYSPTLINQYGIGKILGYPNENDVIITATTKMNIPVQKLPTGSVTTVPQHNVQNNIYFSSYVYSPGVVGSTTPGLQFSSYTTSNVGFYGALDSTTPDRTINSGPTFGNVFVPATVFIDKSPSYGIANGVVTKTSNDYYSSAISVSKYDTAEDLSGGAILKLTPLVLNTIILNVIFPLLSYKAYNDPPSRVYFSPILYPTLTGSSALNIVNSSRNVMRTDRLPSSDYIDSGVINGSVSLLQQNVGFSAYIIGGQGAPINVSGYDTGASQVNADIEGQLASVNVLESLSTCERMVGLNCYSGNSVNFGVTAGCQSSDSVQNGCYVFAVNPWTDLQKDLRAFSEWGFRFRFFYGLCRGVLSQTFTNNWVNGSLYTFPIQVDTYFDQQNKPLPPQFAKELVYFDDKTNNFYYRSSPYLSGTTSPRFIGRPTLGLINPVNDRNLLFPTTIVNLGIKDDFYQEIIFDPSAKGYIMNTLNPTSYSDTSDLVNLFVISRITDEGYLAQLFTFGNNGLNQLFTRPDRRIDGDLAQSMSINSEYGVIPFSPEFYSVYGTSNDPVVILGGLDDPTMGVFFSSTTVDLQNKDFLTPGVIDFRPSNNANAITYPYGIKSQYVPFYQWGLNQPSIQSIFGSQYNDWVTNQSSNINTSGIFGYNYQSLDRRNIGSPSYFIGSNSQVSDIYERGYIFNVNPNGSYSYNAGTYPNKFLVSAPFHFYFGVNKGLTALDKFKTKYSVGE
jgi:hypothetical protein